MAVQDQVKDKRGGRRPKTNWRKDEIVEMAAACFMERGYHATSIDDVAKRLGSTKGRIYHHYATKTDLFFEVHRVGMAKLFAALEPALATRGSGATVLRAMLMAHAEAMLEHHTYENVVAQGVQVHRFNATTEDQREILQGLIDSRDRFEAHFKRVISSGIADGSLRPVDVAVTAKVLLGGLQWSIFWYRPEPGDGRAARRRLAAKMVDPLMDGLGAVTGPDSGRLAAGS